MKNKVYSIICAALDQINEKDLNIKKEPGTVLFGHGSPLDSLGLVNLIVAIEQNIEDEFDASISIASEKAMSRTSSPFRTIDSLTEYIVKLLKEAGHG